MRARSRAAAPLQGRQAHNEARAGDRRLALLVRRAGSVLDPDRPAVGIHDLLGDGETEPRILAKALVRAIGIEPLKHFLEGVRPYAGTVIVDHDLNVVL